MEDAKDAEQQAQSLSDEEMLIEDAELLAEAGIENLAAGEANPNAFQDYIDEPENVERNEDRILDHL